MQKFFSLLCTIFACIVSQCHAQRNVKGTWWAHKSDSGGCQVPQGDYAVTDAIALGESLALGNLKWRQGLCGQVLQVNCGKQVVDAVVVRTCNLNSADRCGVDMITKTWNKATGNQKPGIVGCSVSLTKKNPLKGNGPLCYHRPNSPMDNQWYTCIGVFNTGGRISKEAVLAGIKGYRVNDGYFNFNGNGLTNKNAQVVFKYEDGSTSSL
ncbi:hypothetical protein OUZ56_010783 [Daphnia magna]|uniref:Uncharacterized protein n=1 Tax=Daphnia magna TaxID=35525 RepID=A0ABQ9YYH7_9CRUS|nr:hypothetical protein OUZ56_010783 [Daphnia magna]